MEILFAGNHARGVVFGSEKGSIDMNNHRSFSCFAGLLITVCSLVLFGLATPSCRAADEKLTNASIIELQGLGLGDGVIIEKIKSTKCDFDTSIAGLKQLKEAKIS